MRIIEEADLISYTCTCHRCGTKFEYDFSDTEVFGSEGLALLRKVECPVCHSDNTCPNQEWFEKPKEVKQVIKICENCQFYGHKLSGHDIWCISCLDHSEWVPKEN